ncbi:hypothetical protein QE381_002666 [Microbacterium sp. SORGH_AS 888]|nr:hypothetical protein [Microbacterium sp. SORGH_AS_0888]
MAIWSGVNPFSGLVSVLVSGSPGSTLITTKVSTYADSTTRIAWPSRLAA